MADEELNTKETTNTNEALLAKIEKLRTGSFGCIELERELIAEIFLEIVKSIHQLEDPVNPM